MTGKQAAFLLGIVLLPTAAQARSVVERDDVRLCGLVERTPWGFGALESPPALDGYETVLDTSGTDGIQARAFGCAGPRRDGPWEL